MDRKETFVSDELATMLMLQISHEQKNANLYAAISNYFDSIGLEGCHQWFKHQTEEETIKSVFTNIKSFFFIVSILKSFLFFRLTPRCLYSSSDL